MNNNIVGRWSFLLFDDQINESDCLSGCSAYRSTLETETDPAKRHRHREADEPMCPSVLSVSTCSPWSVGAVHHRPTVVICLLWSLASPPTLVFVWWPFSRQITVGECVDRVANRERHCFRGATERHIVSRLRVKRSPFVCCDAV